MSEAEINVGGRVNNLLSILIVLFERLCYSSGYVLIVLFKRLCYTFSLEKNSLIDDRGSYQ